MGVATFAACKNMNSAIIDALRELLAANPHEEMRDPAGIIVARRVDAAIRRKAIEDCLAVAEKAVEES